MRGNLIDVIDENPMLVEDEPFISAEESLGNVNDNKCELMGTVEKGNEINDCNGKTEDNKGLISDNRGIGVVEIVLILVVLVALVLIFKDKIMEIINNAFDSISTGAEKI